MIKITNLNKYFFKNKNNEIHVINNTSIEFPETGLVTIYGESGCGKTTLLNVLGGLDDFYNGTIEIDDYKLKKYSYRRIDRVRNEKIGYIFQNYLLLQHQTVYENLKIILNMYKLSDPEIKERIDYVLKAVGMFKYKKRKVSELSGGQQQRVSIARALIKSPSLILADEPTGNLDEKNTIEIMNILKKISKNTLVILVSHEQNIVNSYSDYIIQVKDGKVLNQEQITERNIYKLEDDQNIYLKEYKYEKIENDNVSIDFYSNDNKKINLKIVYKNRKFYIDCQDDAIYIDKAAEVKFVDDFKKELDAEEEVLNSDFELKKIKFVKSPSLSFTELIKIARDGLSKLKKRTIFLSFPLFIISALVLLSVQSIVSAKQIDKQGITSTHSGVYSITLEKGAINVLPDDARVAYDILFEDLMTKNPSIEPLCIPDTTMKITIEGFSQIEAKSYDITNFSLLTTEQITEDKLIYGRMPENSKEIIVEKWVLENAFESSTLGNFMTISSFIDEYVKFKPNNFNYKIVGIADSNQNAVYINKWNIFNIALCGFRLERISIGSLSELRKYIDNDSLTLADDEIYWNNSNPYGGGQNFILNKDFDLEYKLKDKIDCGECPFDVIINDNQYYKILKSVMKYDWEIFNVFCETEEEKNQVETYIKSIKEYYESGDIKTDLGKNVSIKLFSNSNYDDVLLPYLEEADKLVSSRILVTFTILLLSVIIVFFLMKSYAMKNIYDIGVYRAIGIKKSSIVFIYAIEVLIISLKTTLISNLLCFAVSNIIASIPVIDVTFAITLPLFLACTFSLILINVLVGIIPICSYLRLTPSKILTKYDA